MSNPAEKSQKKAKTQPAAKPAAAAKRPPQVAEALLALPSAEELRAKVVLMSHHDRVNLAARIGRQYAKDPKLQQLIADLRKHPAPVVPVLPAEEGAVDLLPPQFKNVAKYYHEDELALVMAAASKSTAVMKDEVLSPSTFFKKLATRAFVYAKDVQDADLLALVQKVPSATRNILIHHIIGARRHALMDQLFPILLRDHGYDYSARVLHGCTTPVVQKYLSMPEHEYSRRLVDWRRVCEFHPTVIIFLMRRDMAAKQGNEVNAVWNRRHAERRFLFNAGFSGEVLKLYTEFPPVSYVDSTNVHRKRAPAELTVLWPELIVSDAYFRHFLHRHMDQMFQLFKDRIDRDSHGRLRHNIPHAVYTKKSLELPFNKMLELADYALSACKNFDYGGDGSFTSAFLTNLGTWVRGFISPGQLDTLEAVVQRHLDRLKPQPFDRSFQFRDRNRHHYSTSEHWFNAVSAFSSAVINRRVALLSQRALDVPVTRTERPALVDQFSAALQTALERWLPYMTVDWDQVDPKKLEHASKQVTRVLGYLGEMQLPGHILYVFSYAKAYLDVFVAQGSFSRIYNDNYYSWEHNCKSWGTAALRKLCHACDTLSKSLPAYKPAAETGIKQVFDYLSKFYLLAPVVFLDVIAEWLPFLPAPYRLRLFEGIGLENIKAIAGSSSATLTGSIFPYLPTEAIQPAITMLLKPGTVSDVVRDLLLAFQDLNDPKVRNSMQKGANSANPAERQAAIDSLLAATFRSKSVVQCQRTLKFLRDKVKNESWPMRSEVIQCLRSDNARQQPNCLFDEVNPPAEYLQLWYDLWTDASEAADLPPRALTELFLPLSKMAFEKARTAPTSPLFNFAFELQWRTAVFYEGERGAAEKWRVDLPDPYPIPEELTSDFVNTFYKCYETRVAGKNAEWVNQFSYVMPLFPLCDKYWLRSGLLQEKLTKLLAACRAESKKDPDGLLIIESDVEVMKVFPKLMLLHPNEWDKIPVLSDYVETILRSRQANTVLWQWLDKMDGDAKTRRERREKRDRAVFKLLSITPSAIHLRFVWRHLLRYHQDKLAPFVGEKKTFRGVFFQPPVRRTIAMNAEDKKARMLKRQAKKAAQKKANGGKKKKPKKAISGAAAKAAFSAAPQKKARSTEMLEKVEEEIKQEADVQDDLQKGKLDHRDLFCLEACFGLHRLPAQLVERLAACYRVMAFNPDRPAPEKSNAMKRWTLMPTVSYADIVAFLEENDPALKKKDDKAEEPVPMEADGDTAAAAGKKEKRDEKGLPVSLIEALLRGTVFNDEPCAPLRFLLSPRFLSSDRARCAVYAVCACVPYMPVGYLTRMIKLMLTGNRRKLLKVTAFKEIIRLLVAQPTQQHIEIILHEWNRPELHRDLRIVIIYAALKFLCTSSEEKHQLAWKIIDGAAALDQPEILIALLGVRASSYTDSPPTVAENELEKPRLTDYLHSITRVTLPVEQGPRFASTVILKLCTAPSSADVKYMALRHLDTWHIYLDGDRAAAESKGKAGALLFAWLSNLNNPLLCSELLDEQAIYVAQAKALAHDLVQSGARYDRHGASSLDKLLVFLCDALLIMRDRPKRVLILDVTESVVQELQNNAYTNERPVAMAAMERTGLFWPELQRIRSQRLISDIQSTYGNGKVPAPEPSYAFLEEMFRYTATHPHHLSLAQQLSRQVAEAYTQVYRSNYGPRNRWLNDRAELLVGLTMSASPLYFQLVFDNLFVLSFINALPSDMHAKVIIHVLENLSKCPLQLSEEEHILGKLSAEARHSHSTCGHILQLFARLQMDNKTDPASVRLRSLQARLFKLVAGSLPNMKLTTQITTLMHLLLVEDASQYAGQVYVTSGAVGLARTLVERHHAVLQDELRQTFQPKETYSEKKKKELDLQHSVYSFFIQAVARLTLSTAGDAQQLGPGALLQCPQAQEELPNFIAYLRASLDLLDVLLNQNPEALFLEGVLGSVINMAALYQLHEMRATPFATLTTHINNAFRTRISREETEGNVAPAVELLTSTLKQFLAHKAPGKLPFLTHRHPQVAALLKAITASPLIEQYHSICLHAAVLLLAAFGPDTAVPGQSRSDRFLKMIWRPSLEGLLEELSVSADGAVAKSAMKILTYRLVAVERGKGQVSSTELRAQLGSGTKVSKGKRK